MERIELYPIFNRYTVCNDHYDGELEYPGDALGRDCMIAAYLPEKLDFMRLYKGDGTRNEDWFSWNAEVYAPVVSVGEEVKEGQLLAYVGNNGFCRNPHIHVGAYRGDQPLMVGFDAQKVGKVREKTDECYWVMGISDAEFEKMMRG